MKKVINGKMYNTDTAKMVGRVSKGESFNYFIEELYQKKTNEFFIYGEGGAMTKYAESCGNNNWCGGCKITPVTEQEAKEWAEEYLNGDEYIEIFGEPEE